MVHLKKTFHKPSFLLKFCVFTTGITGIISEYVFSTLASYFIGNPIIQWTVVISLMLFAMGLGSRLSKFITEKLLDVFIIAEFFISILCAISAVLVYFSSIYITNIALTIYPLSFIVGILIGVEIPLVTRMNDYYEELRSNIASILEKDYLGALVGGIFFAFVAIPYLGLTYTPLVFGIVNFIVVSVLLVRYFKTISMKKVVSLLFFFVFSSLTILSIFIKPIIIYSEQSKYKDKIIYSKQTIYQKIVMTRWRDHYWLFINGNEQFSSFDEERYHEPLVHPPMSILKERQNILILGGGDGLALREVLKYNGVISVTVVDIDPEMTSIAKEHPVLVDLNKNSMNDRIVQIINKDAFKYLEENDSIYNLIIIDLPDPNSIELSLLYTKEFYLLAKKRLSKQGVIVTQASSPIYTEKAFLCIIKTMRSAGFAVLPYHNQIPTMGHWGWALGAKNTFLSEKMLYEISQDLEIQCGSCTRFINKDTIRSMTNFWKGLNFDQDNRNMLVMKGHINYNELKINTTLHPILYKYYQEGLWDIY